MFQKNNLKIINADCMNIMKQYNDNYFDLAIVDPPYGINADKRQNRLSTDSKISNRGKYKKYNITNWDDKIPSINYFKELKRVSKNQIIWGGNYFYDFKKSGVIIWYKGNSGNFKEGELAKTNFNTFKVFKYSRADAYINDCVSKIHPTQKPVKLYQWLLENYSNKDNKILDTHLGSGSSAIAAFYYGCKEFTGIEIDTDYYNKSIKRIQQETVQIKLF